MGKNKIPRLMEKVTHTSCWFVGLAVVGLSLLVLAPATVADEAPAGAPKAELGFPPVGTQLVYKTVDSSGKGKTQTFTVLEEGTYKGRPVYQMSDGVVKRVFDKATGSWIATLRNGKLFRAATPHWGNLSFPLWVGKSWTAQFDFYYGDQRRTIDVTKFWKVVAYEDVTVPAGTFKVFKLEGRDPYVHHDMWYSPEIKHRVKWVREQQASQRQGYDKKTIELLEYRPK